MGSIFRNIHEKEISRLIGIYESTRDVLDDRRPLSEIMRDPAAVSALMRRFDMKWHTPDDVYPERLAQWRSLLDAAQKSPSAGSTVIDALFTHIADMTRARPVPGEDGTAGDGRTVAETAGKPEVKKYGHEDDGDELALKRRLAETSVPRACMYGDTKKPAGDGWNSVRAGTRPPVGVPVLVAGWHLPGAVEQCTGVWLGDGRWSLMIRESYNMPRFTPLLWRELPDVPEYIMCEVPE